MSVKNDKINFFSKIIYERIDEENKRELDAFRAEKEKKISELKANLEKKRIRGMMEAEKKARFRANEIVSNENAISRRNQMALVEKLIQKTVKAIESRFASFVETSEYGDVLLGLIEQTLPYLEDYEYGLCITDNDLKIYGDKIDEVLRPRYKGAVELEVASFPIIGGIIFEEKNKRFALDNSISSLIEENKSYIGLRVTELLESGGETAWKANAGK